MRARKEFKFLKHGITLFEVFCETISFLVCAHNTLRKIKNIYMQNGTKFVIYFEKSFKSIFVKFKFYLFGRQTRKQKYSLQICLFQNTSAINSFDLQLLFNRSRFPETARNTQQVESIGYDQTKTTPRITRTRIKFFFLFRNPILLSRPKRFFTIFEELYRVTTLRKFLKQLNRSVILNPINKCKYEKRETNVIF